MSKKLSRREFFKSLGGAAAAVLAAAALSPSENTRVTDAPRRLIGRQTTIFFDDADGVGQATSLTSSHVDKGPWEIVEVRPALSGEFEIEFTGWISADADFSHIGDNFRP